MNWALSAIDISASGPFLIRARATESSIRVKQFVTYAQLIMEKIGQGLDPGNALESGVAQYPEVGVEFIDGFG